MVPAGPAGPGQPVPNKARALRKSVKSEQLAIISLTRVNILDQQTFQTGTYNGTFNLSPGRIGLK